MTQHYFTENVPGGLVTIVRAAIGTQAEGITDVDIGKAVKMSDAQNYVLTADGDNIEGVINSIEAWTVNEGYAFGGVQTGCRFVATVVTGATVAVLDAVISGVGKAFRHSHRLRYRLEVHSDRFRGRHRRQQSAPGGNLMETMFTYTDPNGRQAEVPLSITEYKAAGENSLTLPQHMERRCNPLGLDNPNGTAFEQAIHQAGLFMHPDPRSGIRSPSMKEVLSDSSWKINAAAVVAPDGSQRNTVSGRFFYPAVILEAMQAELLESNDPWIAAFDRMVAQTVSVTSPRYDQPKIHVTGPENDEYRSQPMAQLAEPPTLITITTSEVSRNIPTLGIGMLISDQALESSTLDLVGLAFSALARAERIRGYEEDFA